MEELEIVRTRKGFYIREHDYDEEILCFERRGKIYCFLRDRKTKRFIQKLDKFNIQYIGVFERCYPGGCRKGKGCSPSNNIHVECHECETIYSSDHDNIWSMMGEIQFRQDAMRDYCIRYCFSEYGVEPEKEMFMATVWTCNYECYMDRC